MIDIEDTHRKVACLPWPGAPYGFHHAEREADR